MNLVYKNFDSLNFISCPSFSIRKNYWLWLLSPTFFTGRFDFFCPSFSCCGKKPVELEPKWFFHVNYAYNAFCLHQAMWQRVTHFESRYFIRTKIPTKTAKISNSGNFVFVIEKMLSLRFSFRYRLSKVVRLHYRQKVAHSKTEKCCWPRGCWPADLQPLWS